MRPQLLFAALTALISSGCYSAGDGLAPPLDQLYFPTGLALDNSFPDQKPLYLYAASSDFDLQYRSSGLISFDLEMIRAAVPHNCDDTHTEACSASERCDTPNGVAKARSQGAAIPDGYVPSYVCVPEEAPQPCGTRGEQNAAGRLLYPGRCNSFEEAPFIHSKVGIGAFATNVIFAADPSAPGGPKARLFLPVRGDATLHWIDLDHGNLNCDQQTTSDDSCGESHRAGHDPAASNNNITQPAEPFGIAITDSGGYLAITNQTLGSVSLYTHDWSSAVGPQLVSILGNLPQAPVAIAAVPQVSDPSNEFAPAPGFLVAYRNAAQIDLLRVRNDDADSPSGENYSRYSLTYAGSAPIGVNSLGYDSRDIVIDGSKRIAGCTAESDDPVKYAACLRNGPQPEIYVANRAPSSLVVGSMTADAAYANGSSDLPSFTDSIALTTGPSRFVTGLVKVPRAPGSSQTGSDEHGDFDFEPRVFVVCFDSTRIFVYDPTRHVIDSIIDTGRGPYALAVDSQSSLAYVGFFTDSYLGVVSLDQRFPQTYATVIANIGTPTPPRSSK
jgi:hypothetical protein